MRSRSAPSLGALAVVVVVVGVGCKGNHLSATGVSAGKAPIALSVVVGGVAPCEDGFAHPNICCRQGACVQQPGAPFAACDEDALLFPDRRRCCSLDAPETCVDSPETAGAGNRGACALPCGPEGRPPGAADLGPGFQACLVRATNPCLYCCSGGACTSNVCHCPPAATADGGVCACNVPQCGGCPGNWQPAFAQIDVCCRTDSAGAETCFSQSTEVLPPAEGGSTLAGPGVCDNYLSRGGHLYELSCHEAATPQCLCSMDGVTTASTSSLADGCALSLCGYAP